MSRGGPAAQGRARAACHGQRRTAARQRDAACADATCEVQTPLGAMRLAASGGALVGAWFTDQDDVPPPGIKGGPDEAAVLARAGGQLQAWFRGDRRSFDVPMQLRGTPFQVEVWRALGELPFGTTIGYGELARRLGRPGAARAVARAVGRNPLSLFIACHRVVGHDTALTGFGGGLPRKRALLVHEGHVYHAGTARARGVSPGQLQLSL